MVAHAQSFADALADAQPRLVAAARLLADDPSDAEDAVQECALRAFRGWSAFRGGSSPTTWMYAILLNVLRSRRPSRPSPLSIDAAASLRSPVASPDAAAEQSDEMRLAMAHLRELPARQREIVVLHYIDSLTYREIAEALGVSVGTVKQSIFRARSALRAALDGNHAERTVKHGLP